MTGLRVAITGATGFLGAPLCDALAQEGHIVQRLVRDAPRLPGDIRWDARSELHADALEGTDAVVHLAGESLGHRWSAARKERIVRSRVDSTALLATTLAALRRPPKVLIAASGIGYYGDRGEEWLDESSPPGVGFLPDLVQRWEAATGPAADAGIRVVNLRIGIVLGPGGGALSRLLPPFLAGVGGRIGNGRAWWSWIDLDDQIRAMRFAIERESLAGAVNLTAPNPVRMRELTRTLARVLRRPHLLPVPAAALKAALGEMAEEVLFASQRVAPRKLQDAGFRFLREDLEPSLRAQLGRPALRTDPP